MPLTGFFAPVFSSYGTPARGFTQHGTVRPPSHHIQPTPVPAEQAHGPVSDDDTPSRQPASRPDGADVPASAGPRSIPIVTLTRPTPMSSPCPSAHASSFSSAPPSYISTSPPKYAIVPHSDETALLFAPPPTFNESTRCGECLESSNQCRRCRRAAAIGETDWLVRLLILLNLIVWGIVVWGYLSDMTCPDWDWSRGGLGSGYGGMGPGCLWASAGHADGGPDATSMCWWALEDC